MSYNHAAMMSSKSKEWFTPPVWADRIAAFLGGIDLDPAARGSQAIPAKRHETVDGLGIPWRGKVYLNPPFGDEIALWVAKALTEPVDEIVMLLPGRIDTRWFDLLWDHCTVCNMKSRVKFIKGRQPGEPELEVIEPDKKPKAINSATFPTVLAYRGTRHDAFARAFSGYGRIVRAVSPLEYAERVA